VDEVEAKEATGAVTGAEDPEADKIEEAQGEVTGEVTGAEHLGGGEDSQVHLSPLDQRKY